MKIKKYCCLENRLVYLEGEPPRLEGEKEEPNLFEKNLKKLKDELGVLSLEMQAEYKRLFKKGKTPEKARALKDFFEASLAKVQGVFTRDDWFGLQMSSAHFMHEIGPLRSFVVGEGEVMHFGFRLNGEQKLEPMSSILKGDVTVEAWNTVNGCKIHFGRGVVELMIKSGITVKGDVVYFEKMKDRELRLNGGGLTDKAEFKKLSDSRLQLRSESPDGEVQVFIFENGVPVSETTNRP